MLSWLSLLSFLFVFFFFLPVQKRRKSPHPRENSIQLINTSRDAPLRRFLIDKMSDGEGGGFFFN